MAAQIAQPAEPSTGPGIAALLSALLLSTLVAVAGGGAVAWLVHVRSQTGKEAAAGASQPTAPPPPSQLMVRPLTPVLTRLKGEGAPWMRLNVSAVIPRKQPEPDRLAEQAAEDILAYVATLAPEQILGPTNFVLLKSDLREIVRIRSRNKDSDIFITGFILE